ncbi:flagellar hook-length control protein FliK [Sphingobium sp. WCS2017Hpa-17]|uniref:flagellar hook-length control protein FliK n=1 Tax=Sphingobium sp. WCS2017Hpa-17 TaxID=3073638 RepID=UPI00288C3964|nr:flagellar hook-length control protein FliK [Sphingobium sp. WCS2017Hpa-17]
MTMLTSLKALLFPTPARTGVKGDAMPTEGSAGFAQLLNSMGTTPTPVAQPTEPAPATGNGADVSDDIVEYHNVRENSWRQTFVGTPSATVSAGPASDVEKPQLAVQLAVAHPDSETTPAVAISASAPTEAAAAPVTAKDVVAPRDPTPANDIPADRAPAAVAADTGVEAAIPLPDQPEGEMATPLPTAPMSVPDVPTAPAAVEQQSALAPVKVHPVRLHEAAPLDTVTQSLPAATPDDAPEAAKPSSDDAEFAVRDDNQPLVQPTITVMAPPTPVAAPATLPTATADGAATRVEVAGPSAASRPAAAPTPKAQPAADTPVDSVNVATRSTPETPASPAPAMPTRSLVASGAISSPAEAEPLSPGVAAPEASAMVPLSVEPASVSTDMLVKQPAIGKALPDTAQAGTAISMPAATPAPATAATPAPATAAAAVPSVAVATAPLPETVTTTADVPVAPAASEPVEVLDPAAPDLAQAASPTAPAKPRAEAVSLLQLVRDHMSLRAPRRTETAAPISDATPDAVPLILPTAVNDSTTPLTPLVQPTAQPLAPAAPAMPTVDLSASLGAQVVDMGVSGQWIDGLARDIAGLSANGAQGRFQINATELGSIQVDIRQGDDGAAISLTVATEAAEQALRQDSDRLKLDASLSAVRISDVKIERAPQPAETARADSTASQSTAQQQSGSSSQNPGQAAGQNMGQSSAQSHMQGRGQQRENIAFGHKAGNDGAVLNHMDAGDTAGGAARARYA